MGGILKGGGGGSPRELHLQEVFRYAREVSVSEGSTLQYRYMLHVAPKLRSAT